MSVARETLYIKGDQNVEVKNQEVTLGDIVTMECAGENVVNKLNTVKIMKIPDQGKHRYVLSVLKIIERIHGVVTEFNSYTYTGNIMYGMIDAEQKLKEKNKRKRGRRA